MREVWKPMRETWKAVERSGDLITFEVTCDMGSPRQEKRSEGGLGMLFRFGGYPQNYSEMATLWSQKTIPWQFEKTGEGIVQMGRIPENSTYSILLISIVKCPACSKEVSSDASACPGCGHPIQTEAVCPNCRSRKVSKISSAGKVGSVLMFGVFSMGKLTKTFQCGQCGFRW